MQLISAPLPVLQPLSLQFIETGPGPRGFWQPPVEGACNDVCFEVSCVPQFVESSDGTIYLDRRFVVGLGVLGGPRGLEKLQSLWATWQCTAHPWVDRTINKPHRNQPPDNVPMDLVVWLCRDACADPRRAIVVKNVGARGVGGSAAGRAALYCQS